MKKATGHERMKREDDVLDGPRVSTQLDATDGDRLRELCVKTERVPAWIIRKAVKEYLDRESA